ncbi:RING/FYVE/PHD zinc finger superfamily protein isoform 2 [Hibiscus syriacus]|uniref:RING/FYVE/PHD zinc finger superfamily protein isoform 2 n=1 Tax=Hibiscus syriacus TaxID=106335 RepID=A0A6A2ZB75_HIBSY|nr:RING/FYVE/PHD zinc finger superfamily protein isoform 2 [Hibiscus syriacus]
MYLLACTGNIICLACCVNWPNWLSGYYMPFMLCKSCSHVMITDDVEDWVYQQLEDTSHLLHGVVHSNGYGHLLRVNGREGGSRVLTGCHIMDFWDRLCKTLAVRKVSVMDVSKKYWLEYRLLHAITKGCPWYGNWGYEFGAGSFALTFDAYKSAVETLSSLPLSIFLPEELKPSTCLQHIISFYRVAPPALLDHCVMELGGKLPAEGMVVNARQNPDTGALEYRLEAQNISITTTSNDFCVANCPPSEEILKKDLKFLYESILQPQTMLSYGPDLTRNLAISSAEKLLDCQKFVKDYEHEKPTSGNGAVVCHSCQLELVDQSEEITPDPPAELVVLPVVEDSTQVKFLLGSTGSVRVRGRCLGKTGLYKFRVERGMERWMVDCICGAKDDDGERMLACDACGVWQHTRCSGINDSTAVPAKFICYRCR